MLTGWLRGSQQNAGASQHGGGPDAKRARYSGPGAGAGPGAAQGGASGRTGGYPHPGGAHHREPPPRFGGAGGLPPPVRLAVASIVLHPDS